MILHMKCSPPAVFYKYTLYLIRCQIEKLIYLDFKRFASLEIVFENWTWWFGQNSLDSYLCSFGAIFSTENPSKLPVVKRYSAAASTSVYPFSCTASTVRSKYQIVALVVSIQRRLGVILCNY